MAVMRNIKYFKIKRNDDLKDIIPRGAYSRKGSLEFFRHVKRNNIKDVEKMIENDRFLVYQHNECN